MKNIKFLSALFLLISITVTLFSACKSKKTVNNETTTEQSTRITTTKVHATDYTYHPITVQTQESVTEYIFTVPPVPTEENKTVKKTDKSNQTTNKKETAPDKKTSDEKIEEISKELALITKTSPVIKGNSATVIIQGTPGAKYSIDFYKNSTDKANYEGLDDITADSSGFASWTFTIENDCEIGNRKIIIKENNSNKFIQTSITIQ